MKKAKTKRQAFQAGLGPAPCLHCERKLDSEAHLKECKVLEYLENMSLSEKLSKRLFSMNKIEL